jgi:hypothetical protein
MEVTIVCEPRQVICVEGHVKGSRHFAYGGGMDFYVTGAIGNRHDAVINTLMNKAIEHGVSVAVIRIVKYNRKKKTVSAKQMKMEGF